MTLRVVEEAERPPRKCAVTGRAQGPFIDFQVQIDPGSPNVPNNLYLRAAVVEDAAKKLGMASAADLETALDQLSKVTAELEELRADHEAVAHFMERFAERPVPAPINADVSSAEGKAA